MIMAESEFVVAESKSQREAVWIKRSRPNLNLGGTK